MHFSLIFQLYLERRQHIQLQITSFKAESTTGNRKSPFQTVYLLISCQNKSLSHFGYMNLFDLWRFQLS